MKKDRIVIQYLIDKKTTT